VPDRTAAELWRGRYLLAPASEVPSPDEDEVYLHDLIGMRVDLEDGATVGTVEEVYELPLGLAVDVRRVPPRQAETILLPWDERTVASVDREARVIVVTPPEGWLE
jgi:16S rRNA processing protein RimM